ncbi:MAG: CoB--CoM heterodisulfide reductase iron-sulfur subunit A family protein [Methanobacteriota archaeon]|nr:MAG: CoB--CoM heterodisulfide reductase iron-sulfur subunit A family protein [Euryarchaeota archaeon]
MKRRVQVVICRTCSGAADVLDVDRLLRVASDAPYVGSAVIVNYACNKKSISEIVDDAKSKEVDRLLLVPCSKKDVSPTLFQAYVKKAKMNEFLMETVDLVGEAALPHRDDPARAQAKAEAKLLAAIARTALLEPLHKITEDMRTKNVVVIGAGVAGVEAATTAANLGMHTIIIEKSEKKLKVPGVMMTKSRVISTEGHAGNYSLSIEAGEKRETLECAAVVVASGGDWSDAERRFIDAAPDSKPLYQLDRDVSEGKTPDGTVIIIDTPDPEGARTAAQDFAWEEALDCAIEIRKKSPATEVYLLFQEMRAMGLAELAYKEAAGLGVTFVRYDAKRPPEFDSEDGNRVTVLDMAQDETLSIAFDALYYASVSPNPDNIAIADALRIPMSPSGGIRRGSIQRGPVTTLRPGIFVCGSAKFPKSEGMARLEGRAAGLLAAQFAAAGEVESGGSVAEVAPEKCSACLTCVRTCPYEAPFIGVAGKAEIAIQMCQGCGMCAGICPSKAIELHHFTDEQLLTEAAVYLRGDF